MNKREFFVLRGDSAHESNNSFSRFFSDEKTQKGLRLPFSAPAVPPDTGQSKKATEFWGSDIFTASPTVLEVSMSIVELQSKLIISRGYFHALPVNEDLSGRVPCKESDFWRQVNLLDVLSCE
jgi:hypothetical protein